MSKKDHAGKGHGGEKAGRGPKARAGGQPGYEKGTEVTLDRYERFTVCNLTSENRTIDVLAFEYDQAGNNVEIAPVEVLPGIREFRRRSATGADLRRITLQYGQTGAKKWFTVDIPANYRGEAAEVDLLGPDYDDVKNFKIKVCRIVDAERTNDRPDTIPPPPID